MLKKTYPERKFEEILFLLKTLNENIDFEIINGWTRQDFITCKNNIRAKMRSNTILNNADVLNTNIKNISLVDDWLYVIYSYRRYSAYISDYRYNYFNDEFKFYVNSGMSAISSVFLALKDMNYNIESDKLYFESSKLLESLSEKHRKKVYMLDSLENNVCIENMDTEFTIIDSTCLSLVEEQALVDEMKEKSINGVLIRSNVKLDMLGLDYSNVGTVRYIYPHENCKFKYDELLNRQIQWLGRFGAFPDPCDIPVFWSKKWIDEFCTLNERRISICRYNNKLATEYLKNKYRIKAVFPICKLFVLIPVKSTKDETIKKIFEKLKKKFVEKDLPVYNKGSFGADVTLLDFYQDWETNRKYMRIAFSDLDTIEVREIVDLVIHFYKTIIE